MTSFPKFQNLDIDVFPKKLELKLNQNLKDIALLLSSNEPRTWENLIAPLELMEDDIERFWAPLSHLHSVVNNTPLRHCYQACLPLLTRYQTALSHDKILCEAIQSIDQAPLNATQKKVIENILLNFKLAGVFLDKSKQARFETIQEELASQSNTFETHVLDCENQYEYWVESLDMLKGLPEHAIETALETAKAKGRTGWCLTLAYPCYLAVMTYAENRTLRESLYFAYQTRASEIGPHDPSLDNTTVMYDILKLRTEEAELVGFSHYSAYSLATKMASSGEEVIDFLSHLSTRAYPKAQEEFKTLKTYAASHCDLQDIQPWDISYVSQKMKQALFSISDEALRTYFPLPHVLEEIRKLLHKLFGISFRKITLETWHNDVECYELIDEKENIRGYLYLDLFARPHKRNGAWMDSLQSRRQLENGETQHPIATLTCNFAKPTLEQVPTLTHDEVITLLHELGHCLHHTLTCIDTHSVAGIHGVEWDAVELPSQFFENWGWERHILRTLSSHIDTKEPLPEEMISQLIQSKNFQSALGLIRQVEFSLFDFELHQSTETTIDRVQKVLSCVREKTAVLPVAAFNRFQNSFTHIFAGGYAAGYYSYLWAEVLSCDAFARFEENGLLDEKIGRDFLHCILEVGGSKKASEAFIDFRGRPPQIDALLRNRGMI
jgi:oligopeptidase A